MENKSVEVKKGITELFNKVSPVFDSNGPRFFAYFGERLVQLSEVKVGEKVLDVATGKGASLFSSAKKVGEYGTVIGIDIAEGMVKETSLEIQRRGIKNTEVMVMDAEELEFTSEKFNHIHCGFGIFFFPNYKVALNEFMRVLKVGGRFSFTTFLNKNDKKFIWLDKLVEKYLPELEEEAQEENGPNFDTEEELYKILDEANFKNIKILNEEKTFFYKDEQEWWDKLWTHGYLTLLEAIPQDKMAEFKTEVFDNLSKIKEPEGIAVTMFVLYAFGEK